jgi:predicted transcriptional regulator
VAKIIVEPNEFADIVISFLFDKMLHPKEIVPNNDDFNEFIEKIRGKGLKTLLMQYFLNMDSRTRVKYKIIKDVLEEGSSQTSVINISPEKVEKKKEISKGLLKNIIKKLIGAGTITDKEKKILLESLEEEYNG